MADKKALNSTKSLVPVKYYEIFAYRLIGLTYKQIGSKTNYSEGYIKHLFCSKGVLFEFWLSWLKMAKEESIEEALTMMFGHLPDIVRANIIDAKTTGSMIGIAARKILFEYTLGKPEERLKLDAKLGIYTFADWIKAETLKDKANKQANKYETEQAGDIS